MNASAAKFNVNQVFSYLPQRRPLWTSGAERSNVHARFQFIEFTGLSEEI